MSWRSVIRSCADPVLLRMAASEPIENVKAIDDVFGLDEGDAVRYEDVQRAGEQNVRRQRQRILDVYTYCLYTCCMRFTWDEPKRRRISKITAWISLMQGGSSKARPTRTRMTGFSTTSKVRTPKSSISESTASPCAHEMAFRGRRENATKSATSSKKRFSLPTANRP